MRIAIIGAGISGIGTAHIFHKAGYQVIIFEKASQIGGVWANAYPEVRLQNTYSQYHFSDFPWPEQPDLHPTAQQILHYLQQAVQHFQLDIRLEHTITHLEKQGKKWVLTYEKEGVLDKDLFDYVIVSTGQYTEDKLRPRFPGYDGYKGDILTGRELENLEEFRKKEVLVLGYGKSALDMAAFAAQRALQVHHVFRTARWLVPRKLFGIHYTILFFCRVSTLMVPSWVHPGVGGRFIHQKLGFLARGFWELVGKIFGRLIQRHGKGGNSETQIRLKIVSPEHTLTGDLRSSVALAPESYYSSVANGKILPYKDELASFSSSGVKLKSGKEISCDLVMLSIGSGSPSFPYFSEELREILESAPDGVQLYRHLIHPDIPQVGFAGFNHGFMHIPLVEVGAIWLLAYWEGNLNLPPKGEMRNRIEEIRSWKRENIHFEPSRCCGTNLRFQQYLDTLMKDLGISPYRKLPNVLAEVFIQYGPQDYVGIFEAYIKRKEKQQYPKEVLPLST